MDRDNYNYESPIIRIQNQLLEETVKKEEDYLQSETNYRIPN